MKQVILVRTDLKMPKGKAISQACHAAVESTLKSPPTKITAWKIKGMKKVVLKVHSEEDLLYYQRKAQSSKLVSSLIKDAGKTFFKKPTYTCLAIGPDSDKKIDKITGALKLIN